MLALLTTAAVCSIAREEARRRAIAAQARLGALDDAAAAIDAVKASIRSYSNIADTLRRAAITALLLAVVASVAMSVLTPFKLFPKAPSLVDVQRARLVHAIKHYQSPIQAAVRHGVGR
jgi:hypothetical protein